MAYLTDDEIERRLESARKMGATQQQIDSKRQQVMSMRGNAPVDTSKDRTQNNSLSAKAGRFVLNTAADVARTATAAPRIAATAVDLLAKTPARMLAQNKFNKLQGQPLTAENIQKQERLAKMMQQTSATPLLTKRETNAYSKGDNALQRIGSGALQGSKAGVGTASTVAGFGGGAPTLLKSILLGAGGGYSTSGNTLEETVGGTAIGGISGAAMYGAGKLANKVGENLKNSKVGRNINPQVPSGPKSILSEKELVNMADDLGLRGSTEAKREQVAKLYKLYQGELDDVLSKSNASASFDDIANVIKTRISEQGDYFVPDDSLFQKYLDRELSLLQKKASGGVLTAKDISEFKLSLGNKLTNAFRKESGALSSAPSAIEGARLDVWRSLDDILTGMEPRAKEITSQMSSLYRLAPGLEKLADKGGVKIFGNNIPVGDQIRGVTDLAGRGLNTGGGIISAAGSAMQNPAVPLVAGMSLARPTSDSPVPQTSGYTPTMPTSGSMPPQGQTTSGIQIKTAYDVASGNATRDDWVVAPDGKSIWNPQMQKFVPYDTKAFGSAGGTSALSGEFGNKINMSQQSIGALINDLETGRLQANPGQVSSRYQGLKSLIGEADPSFLEYKQRLQTATIAVRNAMLGATMSPQEIGRFDLPGPNEPMETALPKLKAVYQELNRWIGGNQ